jgi:bifunctional oligoribonuclease and PAP phosphatase NrnA
MSLLQKQIRESIQKAHRVLVTSHIRPDGDAVGSSLALALALLDAGKTVQVVLSDGIADTFKHLPGSELIRTRAEGQFDLIISVDCSDLKRVGNALEGYHSPDIVIDHHATNGAFGTLNLIEPEAVATASVLTSHMQEWGLSITLPIATNLVTGIITDTLGFRTANTTPQALRQVADLLELGVDMSNLYFLSLVRRTFPAARYWGAGLAGLQYSDGIVWTALSLVDRKTAGYAGNDDADLINIVSSIEGADIAIIFVEQDETHTKTSWRALRSGIDVSQIALHFGGGGHMAAAGADISGSLEDVRQRVLQETREALQMPI